MTQKLEDILGEHGLLSKTLTRYEYRPQQLEMATAVARAFERRRAAIIEAATGTGKTLAYLIPSIGSGKRVVVSTGTKALQEQLYQKDIPFLAEHLPKKFKAALLKGRRNYLCMLRYNQTKTSPTFRSREDAKWWPKIVSWTKYTKTGDRAEIKGLPDDFPTWQDLSVSSEGCLGQSCPHYDACFVTIARREAADADVIVVNHHLFFADLALRDSGFGEILPEYDAVVFDEAHQIESVATSYFGMQSSNWQLRELVRDIEKTLDAEDVNSVDLTESINVLDKAIAAFFSTFMFGLYDGRYNLDEILDGPQEAMIEAVKGQLLDALEQFGAQLRRTAKLGEIAAKLTGRCAEQRSNLAAILDQSDDRYVYFVEVRDNGCYLQASPIDLAHLLRKKLLETHDRVVFTSATLTTGESFDYFQRRIGMRGVPGKGGILPDIPCDEVQLPPVFDYPKNALVYIPRRLPEPHEPSWLAGVITITDYLLNLSQGRAFVLFTSYANMNAVYEKIAPGLPFKTLKQGDAPKSEILEEFRNDKDSVLFATSSFWEGVDVEGESLSLVIIDKLPFGNPSDPLNSARQKFIEDRGGFPFMEFTVPAAALTLKQGFGRLIRSSTDKGVVAILDSRICSKRYGSYFLKTLPPARVVYNASQVKSWWEETMIESEG